jgi:adenylate cyclase
MATDTSVEGSLRYTIAVKIFGIAVSLLVLMGAASLLSLHMTRTVDAQLVVVDTNYFPAFSTLAQANIYSLEESAYIRRLMLAFAETPRDEPKIADLRKRIAAAAIGSDDGLAAARQIINSQISDRLGFGDKVALGRLDTRIEFLQDARKRYEDVFSRMVAAAETADQAAADRLLHELDRLRDEFDTHMDTVRDGMRQIANGAILGTRHYQQHVVELGLALLVIAALLGLTVAATVSNGMVRPVHRLLAGANAVERGALDTIVPVTSRDEIGRLTEAFNNMVAELRVKQQIREVFGRYVDPRIVSGLIDRPELTDPKGSRREMTIMFCDMQGFTSFSEGMTPVGLVNVLNRYLTVISEPVRRNDGIIDKYIGDALMAFWGPPFTGAEEQARYACFAAIEQLALLPSLQEELPDLIGVRRFLPRIQMRIGIATGEVIVGNIGSETTRSYTVIGDTVNVASRLEGANKAYGTRILISAATQRFATDAIEAREVDSVIVVGKSEPEQVFELLGRRGEITSDLRELRDTYADALALYRAQDWEAAASSFRNCIAIAPDDGPSKTLLARIAHFRDQPPAPDWAGVWSLVTK